MKYESKLVYHLRWQIFHKHPVHVLVKAHLTHSVDLPLALHHGPLETLLPIVHKLHPGELLNRVTPVWTLVFLHLLASVYVTMVPLMEPHHPDGRYDLLHQPQRR